MTKKRPSKKTAPERTYPTLKLGEARYVAAMIECDFDNARATRKLRLHENTTRRYRRNPEVKRQIEESMVAGARAAKAAEGGEILTLDAALARLTQLAKADDPHVALRAIEQIAKIRKWQKEEQGAGTFNMDLFRGLTLAQRVALLNNMGPNMITSPRAEIEMISLTKISIGDNSPRKTTPAAKTKPR